MNQKRHTNILYLTECMFLVIFKNLGSFRQLHLTSLVGFRLHGSNASLKQNVCLQDYGGSAYFGFEESVNNTNLSLRKVIL